MLAHPNLQDANCLCLTVATSGHSAKNLSRFPGKKILPHGSALLNDWTTCHMNEEVNIAAGMYPQLLGFQDETALMNIWSHIQAVSVQENTCCL